MIEQKSIDRRLVGMTLIVWMLALLCSLALYTISDDHFGRISPGRQIARYGEMPFRDFFDPGYFLTELSSAAVQRIFGDNLLGEMLLTSSFVATGAAVLFILAQRATGSLLVGVVTAALAVLALGRPYDYDKFLFYPLGLLACWRYTDTRSSRSLVAIAAVAVVAGLFRYDNGVFVVAGGLTVLAAMHARDLTLLTRRAGLFVGACLLGAAPYVVYLQLNGGVVDAVSQMATYARREGARTQVGMLPPGVMSELRVTALPPPPPDRVQIRWTPAADQDRASLEARYRLHDGVERGDPQDRTWLYEIDDATSANLRAIVNDPRVADTHLIDRQRLTLAVQEPQTRRLWRHVPFVGSRSVEWSVSGASAVVYYLFLAVSLGAVVTVLRLRDARPERARVLSAAVMTLLLVVLIMRAPISARIGGVIGPPAVLAAWMWHRFAHRRYARAVVAVCAIAILGLATEWRLSAYRLERNGRRLGLMLSDAAATPPMALLPKPELAGLVAYLRRCTQPDDRVFAAWFVPELYFFSGRAFAGGMAETFGGHWTGVDHQQRIVTKMAAESVPVAVFLDRSSFQQSYGVVDEYLRAHFEEAGTSSFGAREGTLYTVLTRRDRVPTRTDPTSSMPCFAGPA